MPTSSPAKVDSRWLPSQLGFDLHGNQLTSLEEEEKETDDLDEMMRELELTSRPPSLCSDYGTSVDSVCTPTTPPLGPTPREAPLATTSFLPVTTPQSSSFVDGFDSTASSPRFNPVVGTPQKHGKKVNFVDSHVQGTSPSPKYPWTWPKSHRHPVSRAGAGNYAKISNLLAQGRQRQSWSAPLATRYVRVDGVERQLDETGLRQLFGPVMGVRDIFSVFLQSHGVIIISFFDVRPAYAASTLISQLPSSKPLSSFCVTRQDVEELTAGQNPYMSISEGVLVVSIQGFLPFPSTPLFASFGTIRCVRVVDSATYVIEYFDFRDAENAARILPRSDYGSCIFTCSFEPSVAATDLPSSPDALPPPYYPSGIPSYATGYQQPTIFIHSNPAFQTYSPFFTHGSCEYAPHSPDLHAAPPQQAYSHREGRGPYSSPASQQYHAPPSHHYSPSPPPSAQSQPHRMGHPSSPPKRTPFGSVANTFTAKSSSPREEEGPRKPGKISRPYARRGAGDSPMSSTSLPNNEDLEFGTYRSDDVIPAGNVLHLDRIEQGLEMRTTLMIKNLPNSSTTHDLMECLDEVVGRSYDFCYLRIDFKNSKNTGYAFVNFTSSAAMLTFIKARIGKRWNVYHSDKLCTMCFAKIQGKEGQIQNVKNSAVMLERPAYRPRIFYSSGPDVGLPQPFPPSDDPVRLARSIANLAKNGLHAHGKPAFVIARANREYDY